MKISIISNIGIVHSMDNKLALKHAKQFKKLLPVKLLSETKNKKFVKVDLIVVIGGDGAMLHSVHSFRHLKAPFYGINTGNFGFLMNEPKANQYKTATNLLNILNHTEKVSIFPLKMEAVNIKNKKFKALAMNEISIFRQTYQASQMEISVNNKVQLKSFIGDGLMVSTPAGSTAYNLSVGGPILPIDSNLLALTPISPFRPRRWKGALLPNDSEVSIKILNPKTRPISAVADFLEIRDIKQISIKSSSDTPITLLFDKDQNFEGKIIKEQFLY